MWRRTPGPSVLMLVLVVLVARAVAQDAKDRVTTVHLKKVKAREERLIHYGPSLELVPDVPFYLGEYEITPRRDKRGIRLVWDRERPERAPLIKLGSKGAQVTVGDFGRTRLELYVWNDELGHFYRNNPDALHGSILGQDLLLFDLDHDGEYFREGVDAFGLVGSSFLLPWFDDAVLSDHRIERVGYDESKKELSLRLTELGPRMSSDGRRALRALNGIRAWYGLLPCDVDEKLNEWCRQHSAWMMTNGALEHEETAGSAGYTKEGNTAGLNGLIGKDPVPEAALFGLFDTPLHGYEMSSPMMTRVAIGSRGGYLTVWYTQRHGLQWPHKDLARLPAVFPPHRAAGIPVSWWDEFPDPRPGNPSEDWGYPIRVFLHQDGMVSSDFPKDMKVQLVPMERGGAPVPCVVVHDPESVQMEGGYQGGGLEIIVLPRPVLDPKTKYHLHMEYEYKGKPVVWDSVFTTGTQGSFRSALEK